MSTIVNSWDEWAPLKHVIVGRVRGTQVPAPEPAWEYPADKGGFPLGTWGMFPEEQTSKAEEQQENFVKILEKRNIKVDRVEVQPFMLKPTSFSTPDWTQINARGISCPRDVFIVMGNEIIETPNCCRSRWFEYLNLRPLFQKYFKEDPNFIWLSAPKPRLTEESYQKNYFYKVFHEFDEQEMIRRTTENDYHLTEEEPLWDGADAGRAGKDIFWNTTSCVLNKSGLDWIKRHYANRGIRIHPVTFNWGHESWKPWHIDCEFTMVRPGLLIINPEGRLDDNTINFFRRNDWEVIESAMPSHDYYAPVSLIYYTEDGGFYGKRWLSMNTLALGPNTICVEAHETAYMEQLDKMGIEVVPVPYEHVVPFGGSLHCTTLDIYRESQLADYFPNQ